MLTPLLGVIGPLCLFLASSLPLIHCPLDSTHMQPGLRKPFKESAQTAGINCIKLHKKHGGSWELCCGYDRMTFSSSNWTIFCSNSNFWQGLCPEPEPIFVRWVSILCISKSRFSATKLSPQEHCWSLQCQKTFFFFWFLDGMKWLMLNLLPLRSCSWMKEAKLPMQTWE